MLILGIDTSCDDTSASLIRVKDGVPEILSNIVSSQVEIHRRYGGIVPELAGRRHIELIWDVVDTALKGIKIEELSAISVCSGPGLIGSLLVGCSFAKAVCYGFNIPLIAVNHLEGHILSVFLEGKGPDFPFLSLIVSGGHTCIVRVDNFLRYKELGRTRDDAAGEAYDKVSKLLGLGYPGGPEIERLAEKGSKEAIRFPRPYMPESLDFSFSGLKTAVKLIYNKNIYSISDIAASFQKAMVDTLVRKTEWTIKKTGIKQLALSGGVVVNTELRQRMKEMASQRGVSLYIPSPSLCTDNAVMIAFAGYHHLIVNDIAGLDLNPKAYLPLP